MIVKDILYGMNIMKNKLIMKVNKYGTKRWRLPNGDLYRENGPAIKDINNNKRWYLNGKLHREDGPAIEWVDGDKHWYLNGKKHSEDGPAVESINGEKYWYLNDRLYKIQYNNKIIERDKNFDCETCVSQIVCDYDCQRDIIWKEYDKK